MRNEIKKELRKWPFPYNESVLANFLSRYSHPSEVAKGIVDFSRNLLNHSSNTYINAETLLNDTFLCSNLPMFTQLKEAALLRFAPGTKVFSLARKFIPQILEDQIRARFPHLKEVLSSIMPSIDNRKPLSSIESITFEDVKTGVISATTGVYHIILNVKGAKRHLLIKKTDMRIEVVAATILERILSMKAVKILWTGDNYSFMEKMPGKSLRDISGNPLTDKRFKKWNTKEILTLSRELGKESALAYYLHLFSRHTANILCSTPSNIEKADFIRIDFGQSFIDSRHPETESLMPIWHLRRFFPDNSVSFYERNDIACALFDGFSSVATTLWKHREDVTNILKSAIGLPVPEMKAETAYPFINDRHVQWIADNLTTAPNPKRDFNRIYNRFYLDFWQVPGWSEFREPTDTTYNWAEYDYSGILTPKNWLV